MTYYIFVLAYIYHCANSSLPLELNFSPNVSTMLFTTNLYFSIWTIFNFYIPRRNIKLALRHFFVGSRCVQVWGGFRELPESSALVLAQGTRKECHPDVWQMQSPRAAAASQHIHPHGGQSQKGAARCGVNQTRRNIPESLEAFPVLSILTEIG